MFFELFTNTIWSTAALLLRQFSKLLLHVYGVSSSVSFSRCDLWPDLLTHTPQPRVVTCFFAQRLYCNTNFRHRHVSQSYNQTQLTFSCNWFQSVCRGQWEAIYNLTLISSDGEVLKGCDKIGHNVILFSFYFFFFYIKKVQDLNL